MKSMLVLIFCLCSVTEGGAQQTVAEFKCDLTQPGLRQAAAPISIDGRTAVKIENTNNYRLQLTLATITNPKISTQYYAVQGEVRYDAVQGDGFLEMWNYFPPSKPGLPEGEYFSRTLGESGEMGKISGTSGWRAFSLPFNSTGASGPPTRLQINLILPGRGTIYLGPMKLVQYSGVPAAGNTGPGMDWFFGRTTHPWWSNRVSVLGGDAGLFILLPVGLWIGVLSKRGQSRGFVIALLKIHIGVGIGCGAAAIVAFAQDQPFSVWFPLSLYGFLLIVIYVRFLLTIDKVYEEQELRRMQALDVSA